MLQRALRPHLFPVSAGHRRTIVSMSTTNMSLIQNARRPDNWKAAAPFPPATSTTFSRQTALPKLPLPEFGTTVETLKRSLKPLAWSEEEWTATKAKIEKFEKDGGPGNTLHNRLKARRERKDIEHWLEEFWDDLGYLKYRDTVMVNVSYYYGLAHHPPHLPQNKVSRAASLIRGVLLQRQALKQGTMPIDMSRKDPLCMDTWRWMFDCCRIPGLEGADWSVTNSKPGDDGNAGHIIVFRHNRPWKVEVGVDGRLLSTVEIERQLQHIYDAPAEKVPQIGLLTSNDRDSWAKDYAALIDADPQNAQNIEAIVTAAFVVCLDTATPNDRVDLSKTLFHGGDKGEMLGNRWLDKPAQLIVCDNSEAGYMGEHSVMDGTPSVTMMDRVMMDLQRVDFDHGSSSRNSTVPNPEPLNWKTNSAILSSIEKAKEAASVVVSRQAMGMLATSYGRDEIKTCGFSPDAWAQMVIQLAYHRLLGGKRRREGGTYEAASTRGFLKGRTETIRIVTEEALSWCEAMEDSKVDPEHRKALFKEATSRHRVDADAAVKAMGIDRHLFGMKNMLKPGEPVPELFTDPLYARGSTWILSTSAIFSPHFTRGYGWGQVVPNGFGVAYMTGFPDRLEFTVTSRKDQPNAKFVGELERAAEDLRTLFNNKDQGVGKARM